MKYRITWIINIRFFLKPNCQFVLFTHIPQLRPNSVWCCLLIFVLSLLLCSADFYVVILVLPSLLKLKQNFHQTCGIGTVSRFNQCVFLAFKEYKFSTYDFRFKDENVFIFSQNCPWSISIFCNRPTSWVLFPKLQRRGLLQILVDLLFTGLRPK